MDNTPLTHDEHREASQDMLIETKDLTQNTVKIIGEGIHNEDKNLETILFTLVWLSTFGYSYFKGNFADRGRYQSLVMCPFLVFFQMIVSKLKELDLPLIAANLLENKQKFIQFLKDNNWTLAEMASQWVEDADGDHLCGKTTENRLINTKGVMISPRSYVYIGYWNQQGGVTYPMIYCDEYAFRIDE